MYERTNMNDDKAIGQVQGRERRQANVREAIFEAAERLFANKGFNAVSVRDIAVAANAHPGSVTYHFGTKLNLLREIYRRHCGPINMRRAELLREAQRIPSRNERVAAILRAYLVPAFSSLGDKPGGGAQFTRLRAVVSAENNPDTREIRADTFDDTSQLFIDALAEALPDTSRTDLIWRSQFLLGSLYFTLVNSARITRLSGGAINGEDTEEAINQIVDAAAWGLLGKTTEEDQ